MRFALEAMTQMMRTNSDALRSVAASQVDLAKALATAKGLRNGAWFVPSVHDVPDEGDDQDTDEPVEKSWVDLAMPFAQKLADAVPGLVMSKAMHGGAANRVPASVTERA